MIIFRIARCFWEEWVPLWIRLIGGLLQARVIEDEIKTIRGIGFKGYGDPQRQVCRSIFFCPMLLDERPSDLHARSAETRAKRAFYYCEPIPIQWIEDFEVHDVGHSRNGSRSSNCGTVPLICANIDKIKIAPDVGAN